MADPLTARVKALAREVGFDLVGVTSAAIQPNIDNVISYSRSVYELATQTQGDHGIRPIADQVDRTTG